MENFQNELAEILEVDMLDMEQDLDSFETWDSLTILTIIALCDDQYNVSLTAEEINDSGTPKGLEKLIETRQT